MSGKKSGPFNKEGIQKLANDKPVVYEIKCKNGENLYTGSAKRGRVIPRLNEHLPGGPNPVRGGNKVVISPKPSITEAQKAEARKINREKPPQNKIGK